MTLHWKDYAHGNRHRLITLDAVEFLRRFLLHILPAGFQRLRHYGRRANRVRQAKLRRCRVLLQQPVSAPRPVPPAPKLLQRRTSRRRCVRRASVGACPGWKPSTSSPTSSPGGCSRRAGILPNRTSRWADRTALWLRRRTRRGAHLRRATYALSPPWCAVLASASAWLAPPWCEPPSHTPWEHPARRVLRRLTPSPPLRGCKQSP